ncbi:MAG: hypothetical protein NZM38_10490 [Cytophagales bacterium]|nr:hypothetical protein [Cytophagales bacterium]MDW8385182.1 hypothetical protein [Flammeovirgaceae bacterium]
MTIIGKYIQTFYTDTYRTIVFPFRALILIRNLLKKGGIEVYTPFEYQQYQFHLRTIIQIDADILFYLPYFGELHTNQEFLTVFEKHRNIHLQKIETIFAVLESPYQSSSKLVDFVLVASNATSAFQTFAEFSQNSFLVSLTIVGGTILFRQFFKKLFLRWIVKNFLKLSFLS